MAIEQKAKPFRENWLQIDTLRCGIVLVSSCDKAIPAHLMAAARINVPTLHLPGGSARIGPAMTSSVKSGEMTSGYKLSQFSKEEMRSYILSCIPSCGACQFMGTATLGQKYLRARIPLCLRTPFEGGPIRSTARNPQRSFRIPVRPKRKLNLKVELRLFI